MITPELKINIVLGRETIDKYRIEHAKLLPPKDHNPILNILLAELKDLEFDLEKVFDLSDLLNFEELGFTSFEDFCQRSTLSERELLKTKWK